MAHQTQLQAAALLQIVAAFSIPAIAIALYPVLGQPHRDQEIVFAVWLIWKGFNTPPETPEATLRIEPLVGATGPT